ncbi:extracellular solute-binding protein [Oribacterium sp. oral taxon 102]|uniref:ABC transporter substrate-binding protein n=1 Tax=Oribacterium sp. oral taxon 102 TaxID=671214 RepID=UPI0015BA4AB6|nr:extracellular solute-binding protein [Oribacterium sp. oral taxon 102]NWO22179.1 extracellular solute-binding protein [Oribacterium sp. oral taxon 102]
MKKKLITTLLAAATVISAITACGSTSTDSTAAAEQNEASNGSVAATDSNGEEPCAITFTYWGSGAEQAAIEASLETFQQAYPEITVNAIHIPSDDFLTKINSMIAAGETPDISYSASWKCQFGEEGLIYNFFDLAQEDPDLAAENYLDTCWWMWSETESAGPIMANVCPSLMYNKDIMDAADITVPTTTDDAWSWDKFVSVAQQLTLDGNGKNAADPSFDSNNIVQYGVMFAPSWNTYMSFIYSNGGGYLNEECTEFGLQETEAAEVLQNFADLINVYHVAPSSIASNSMPSAASAIASGQAAMYLDGSWNHLDLSEAGCNWGVGVLPISENYTTYLDGGSLIIFKSTEHLDATIKLYKWITNPESSDEITEMFRTIWMPVQKIYYDDEDKLNFWASEDLSARPKGFKQACVESVVNNLTVATEINVKNFSEIDTLVSAAMDEVLAGTKTSAEAMNSIKANVDRLVEGTYNGDRS